MTEAFWESTGAIMTVVTPLVAVPLTIITFYLRSLREHQVSSHSALARRVESLASSAADLRKAFNDFERDYATKEEWLRECMLARSGLEHLQDRMARVETAVQGVLQSPDSEIDSVPGKPRPVVAGRAPRCRLGDHGQELD